ncbi:MAG TPA: MBL fold metallo-hydrolase [Candidatus Dormibacteraeota bacterium]
MRLLICGVRGSTPSPGPQFVRYGGNTSCIAVAHDGKAPTLVLDAGTGLQRLTPLLNGDPFTGTILLGHLHWDHTHGLPFFAAGDRPDADVTVIMPAQGNPEGVLARVMAPPHFPIKPNELRGHWRFLGIQPGPRPVQGFDVIAREIPHKGGLTYGYRVSDGHATIAYLSDHSPTSIGPGPAGVGAYHPAALELARSADLLIHDAQYTTAELPTRAAFGHASVDYAIGLAEAAGARRLLLFHHDPARTDDVIDAILAIHRGGRVPVEAAAEGTIIDLG